MRRRNLLFGAAIALAAVGAGLAFVRLSPIDAASWHADPMTAEGTGLSNDYRVGPDGDRPVLSTSESPESLMTRLDAIILSEPGARVLAGSARDGHLTYLTRTPVLGFPDIASVRIEPDGDGSLLSIWSRSRWGYSDLGANEGRVEGWLAGLGI